MKLLLVVLVALLFASCEKPSMGEARSANAEIEVVVLTKVDGCTLYRAYTGDRYVYFANCNGHADTSWKEDCGKGCTQNVGSSTESKH